MIVGVTPTPDRTIIETASKLYRAYHLRRVYYSAFSPIPDSSSKLPLQAPPLIRENRLYQADWLMRFYGFKAQEITTDAEPNLDLQLDPKLSWALRNRHWFPINVNRAPKQLLLRVPGCGVKNVDRMIQARRWGALRLQDLLRLRVQLKKAMPFIETVDHHPGKELDSDRLCVQFAPPAEQMDLFGSADLERESVITGEI
jgi:predicted DNA-binding helix-hairpin-helix protein